MLFTLVSFILALLIKANGWLSSSGTESQIRNKKQEHRKGKKLKNKTLNHCNVPIKFLKLHQLTPWF